MRRFPIFLLAVVMLTGCKDKTELPTVSTGGNEIFHETHIVACEGMVSDDGGATVFERGICYMTGDGTPTIEGTHKTGGSGRGSFTCPLSNLPLGAYSYRAYAINEVGTAYGEVRAFELTDLPTVSTGSYTVNGSNLTAVCNGTVTYNGGGELTETGICYMSGTGMPTVNNNCVRTEGATASISVTLTGLSYSSNYCYRAFATNSRGTAYGEVRTLNVPPKLPTVTTGTGTPNANNRTAVCTGTVTNSGATSLTETGICYMAGNGTPTINNSRVRTTNAATSINVTLSGLTLGTTYSYRAYATNAGGTSYGTTRTFTMPNGAPTVTTLNYTVGYSTYRFYGLITSHGAGDITNKGVCFITGSGTPTINDIVCRDWLSGDDTIDCFIYGANITAGATYRWRAYATNSTGSTAYGVVKTVTFGLANLTVGGTSYSGAIPTGRYYHSGLWYVDAEYFGHNSGSFPHLFFQATGLNTGTYTGVATSASYNGSYASMTYGTSPSGLNVHSVWLYDENYVRWLAKSFTINVTQIDTAAKRASFTLNAVMYNEYEAFSPDGPNLGMDGASTQNMVFTVSNAELQRNNSKSVSNVNNEAVRMEERRMNEAALRQKKQR